MFGRNTPELPILLLPQFMYVVKRYNEFVFIEIECFNELYVRLLCLCSRFPIRLAANQSDVQLLPAAFPADFILFWFALR